MSMTIRERVLCFQTLVGPKACKHHCSAHNPALQRDFSWNAPHDWIPNTSQGSLREKMW
jgi:hypothetical protein